MVAIIALCLVLWVSNGNVLAAIIAAFIAQSAADYRHLT